MFAIFKCKIFIGDTSCKWPLITTLHTGGFIWPVKTSISKIDKIQPIVVSVSSKALHYYKTSQHASFDSSSKFTLHKSMNIYLYY